MPRSHFVNPGGCPQYGVRRLSRGGKLRSNILSTAERMDERYGRPCLLQEKSLTFFCDFTLPPLS